MNAWLNVIGIGADGLQGLSPAARALVETAEVLVGGERHLAMMPVGGAERLIWELPLEQSLDAIRARRESASPFSPPAIPCASASARLWRGVSMRARSPSSRL